MKFAAILALVLLAVVVGLVIWLGSASGLRFLLDQSQKSIESGGGTLVTEGASGGLYRGVTFDRLEWSDGKTNVVANDIRARWSLRSVLRREIVVPDVSIDQLSIKLPVPDVEQVARTEPIEFPAKIGLPVSFDLDRFKINRLVVHQPVTQEGGASAEPIELKNIQFGFTYQDGAYNLEDFSAGLPWGEIDKARLSLNDTSPHAIVFRAQFEGAFASHSVKVKAASLGNLNGFNTNIKGEVNQAPVSVDVRLRPLEVNPVVSATGWVRKLDLARFEPNYPKSSLDFDFDVLNPRALPQIEKPVPDESTVKSQAQVVEAVRIGDRAAWRGTVEVRNAGGGSLSKKLLPLQTASAEIELKSDEQSQPTHLRLQRIKIGLPGANELASIAGDIEILLSEPHRIAGVALPTTVAALQFKNIDIAQFKGDFPPTSLNGRLDLTRDLFDLDLAQSEGPIRQAISLPGGGRASIKAQGRISDDAVHLDSGLVQLDSSRLTVSGRSSLSAPFDVTLGGALENVELKKWLAGMASVPKRWRNGLVNADWSLNGVVAPSLDARLSLGVARSRLAGHPLTADILGHVKFAAPTDDKPMVATLDDTKIQIRFGANVISANGSLGESGDTLKLSGRLAAPHIIEPRLAGSIGFKGQLSGALDELHARLNSSVKQLTWTQENQTFEVQDLAISADLPIVTTVAPDTTVQLSVNAGRLKSSGQTVTGLRLRVDGKASDHRIIAKGSSNGQRIILDGSGALKFDSKLGSGQEIWAGKITKLRTSGQVRANLTAPAQLQIGSGSVRLSDAEINVVSGVTRIDELGISWEKGVKFNTRGSVKKVPVVALASLASQAKLPAELDGLILDSRFDLAGSSTKDLTGDLEVFLNEQTNADKPGIGLTGKNFARLRLDRGQLDGEVDMRLPSLVFSRSLTGSDWVVDGNMTFAGKVSGRVNKPKYLGVLTGKNLSLLQPALGWRFTDGVLSARFDSDRMTLERLRLLSGDGFIELAGSARLVEHPIKTSGNIPLDGRFTLTADRTVVPIGPGQKLVLSGKSAISSSASGLTWTGNMKADEGLIEIAGSGAPSLPSDVRIVETAKSAQTDESSVDQAENSSDSPQVKTRLNIDLGNKLRVVGGGVDATLTGKLSLHGDLPDTPRVTGSVEIKNGKYFAYSQDLVIKRGVVRFTGAIDNPVLDITAIRPQLPVEVGVSLGGTALSPIVNLVSTPVLSDAETLSWLVLGTPLDNAQAGAQSLALKQAAAALIGSDGSGGGLAGIVGLDVLGMGYASDTNQTQAISDAGAPTGLPGSTSSGSVAANQEVVTLGKKLSKRLSVSYEQGVRGVWNLLRIQYEISNRLSVRAQTGSESAVDLIYFFSFD